MKNNQICPKCNSQKILIIGSNIGYETNYIPLGGFKTVSITKYICEMCGYLENWIEKADDLQRLIDKYKKN